MAVAAVAAGVVINQTDYFAKEISVPCKVARVEMSARQL